ncbi:MAG: MFS transporter [Candidatus Didemnitutus sp.]|nr:MFS transporter [Candidatus Didemnitutus sp.]
MSDATRQALHAAAATDPRSRFRWVVCALLFFVTANNYMDRQVFGVVGPELIKIFGWTPQQYTDVVFWFQVAYGIGFLLAGRVLDLVGTRLGLAVSVCIWSVAAALHGAMGSLGGFKFARFLLGLSEPSHMPAAIKVVAEWFPRSERALATGIYKAGSNVGAITVPLLVPWLFHEFGWRATFLLTASTGFVWLVFWWKYYAHPRESARVSATELAHIESDPIPPPPPKMSWRRLLGRRETWAYMNFKFMTDAMWHWYGAMFPLYLAQHFGLKLKQFGLPLIVIYVIADIGSVGGGWMSSHLIKRGRSVTFARKLAMFVCCAATIPVMLVGVSDNLWLVILLVGVAHAAHQGLTANLFTTVSDLFPRNAVGTVVGLGGTAGQIGAALMTLVTGWALATWGTFTMLFFVAGSTYVVAWLIFHWVVPRLEPLEFARSPDE